MRTAIVTTNQWRPLAVVVYLLVGLSVGTHAKGARDPLVRPLHPSLHAVIDTGCDRSPTFRSLMERLERGNVIVYLQFGQLPGGVQGRLTFLSAVSGFRYVMVDLSRDLDPARLVALVGHELRHAVEILDRPDLVDRATFAALYEESGIRRRHFADGGIGFDTAAAVLAGRQIWRELGGAAVALATR